MKNFVYSTVLFLALFFAGTSATAATIFAGSPDVVIDGVTVANNHPWIAQQIYAIPGSNWRLFFNDNKPNNPNQPPPYFDYDFNDLVVDVSFDGSNEGLANVIYRLSAYKSNTVRFYGNGPNRDIAFGDPSESLGTYQPNEAVKYHLLVNGSVGNASNSQSFYNGGLNTLVQRLPDTPTETPEPATFALMGAGLFGMSLWRFRRNR